MIKEIFIVFKIHLTTREVKFVNYFEEHYKAMACLELNKEKREWEYLIISADSITL